jgi:GT2 family glycosyltransferase
MKIGIGVTTYKRPKCLAKWKEQVYNTITNDDVTIYVAEDTDDDRKGIAARKNECLRALKDCEYVFLFDDDCYPTQAGWIKFFVNSGFEHLVYCDPKFHKCKSEHNNLLLFEKCGGVFMFMKKSAIERVGAFNESYGLYGYEHADYSNRILNIGGLSYPVLKGTEKYIYAEDYSNPKHKSSIKEAERLKHIDFSNNIYNNTIHKIYLPL